jgi:hypothetical protein
MTGRLKNNELKRIRKEVVMVKFNVLSWHLHGGTEENHTKLQSEQLVSGPRQEPLLNLKQEWPSYLVSKNIK